MREWISLLEDESLEDFSFIDSLTKMLNIKKEYMDDMIEKLSVDELSNLVDATINNDIDAAKSIISNNTDIEFDLDKNDEDSEDTDIGKENMNDLIMRDKLTAKRSRENHSIDETADSLSLNIGDTVFVDDEEGTVKIPFAPGNTIGVMIDGELQMINKEKVHVREGVLGMTPMPGLRPSVDNDLQRMQELAGIRGMEANSPSEIEPINSMDIEEPMHNSGMDSMDSMDAMDGMDEPSYMPMIPDDHEPMGETEDGADAIESAISDIESHIPNVSISDYKSIVARLKALVSMAENAGRTALAESKKAKMKLGEADHQQVMYKDLSDVYDQGPTEVWYWKSGLGRDLMMGKNWLIKHNKMPDPENLEATHVKIGSVKETNPENVYRMMQGEVWSPEGQARDFIKSSGTGHTSMSMGDIIVINGQAEMVDQFGFSKLDTEITDESKTYEDKIMVKQPKENKVGTEGTEVTRKTLLDYIREQEMDNTQTLGSDRAAALDTIKNRLGANGNPQAANQAFSKLQSTGKIKQNNGVFTMDSMDDEDFNNAIGQNK